MLDLPRVSQSPPKGLIILDEAHGFALWPSCEDFPAEFEMGHVLLAIRNDEELGKLLSGVMIAQGRVFPNINVVLLPKKTTAAKESTPKCPSKVIEQGPWLIRNVPLILTKWSPNMSLSKDEVTRVPTTKENASKPSTSGLQKAGMESSKEEATNGIKLKNLFEKLNDITYIVDPNSGEEERCGLNVFDATINQHNDDSESDIEEVFVEENPNSLKGASTPVTEVNNV
ncbi:histone H2A [Tanacetum coccineum]